MSEYDINDIRLMHAVLRTNKGSVFYGWFRWTNGLDGEEAKAEGILTPKDLHVPQLFNAFHEENHYLKLYNLRMKNPPFKEGEFDGRGGYYIENFMEVPITKDELEYFSIRDRPFATVMSFPYGFDYVGNIEHLLK